MDEYFDKVREPFVADIQHWISLKSEKGEPEPGFPFGKEPAEVLEAALLRAAEMGFAVRNYENYVGVVSFIDAPVHLDILAHLDVVPADEKDWCLCKPYEPVVKDGRIYGRGAIDDKGPAVAALYAMKAVKDLGIPIRKNVRLILGTDEECGSSDIEYFYEREREAPMTFTPDADFPLTNVEKGRLASGFFASFGESEVLPRVLSVDGGMKLNVVPGEAEAELEGLTKSEIAPVLTAVQGESGVRFVVESLADDSSCSVPRVRILASGKAGHAAVPEDANNALTGLLALLCNLPLADCEGLRCLRGVAALFPHGDWLGEAAGVRQEDDLSGPLTMSLNKFHYDIQALQCEFDSRCPLCATDENVRLVLRENGAKRGLEMMDAVMDPPHHVPADSHFVQTLLGIYTEYTGLEGSCAAIGGGTYVHDVQNGVAFGCAFPETNYRLHGADEFCVISEMILSAKMFAEAIIRLCS